LLLSEWECLSVCLAPVRLLGFLICEQVLLPFRDAQTRNQSQNDPKPGRLGFVPPGADCGQNVFLAVQHRDPGFRMKFSPTFCSSLIFLSTAFVVLNRAIFYSISQQALIFQQYDDFQGFSIRPTQ
jgi:hypothetical protein